VAVDDDRQAAHKFGFKAVFYEIIAFYVLEKLFVFESCSSAGIKPDGLGAYPSPDNVGEAVNAPLTMKRM